MTTGFFITGTDTDVGKTITAGIITQALQGCYWKPIQSGLPDSETIRKFISLPEKHFYPSHYSFKASLSPDQAAALEGITIDLDICRMPQTAEPVIVEGAGGVFTPLNAKKSMLDLMMQLSLPVIVVARGTLGTINHTLLTLDTLSHRKIPVKGIVFCGELNPASQATIEDRSGISTLFHIPYFKTISKEIVQAWLSENQQHIVESLR